MKKKLKFGLGLLIASILFVSCSDDDDNAMPDLSVNNGIVLENGATATITASELNVVDTDTEDVDIVYTVTTEPENGILANIADVATAIDNFTQADIAASKIVYVHNGSQALTDEFSFTVTDGDNVLTGTFKISIGEKPISYFYVLNEGNSNGSVTMINRNDEVTNDYFSSANNGVVLGKYPQSMTVNDDYVFIVVTTGTGAGYVEVANKSDFTHYATIESFSYPREITLAGNKAYVSNGKGVTGIYPNQVKDNNEIYIVDLESMSKTGEIGVGAGPEKMVVSNDKLYVANSGGWSNDDNTVTVIDTDTDKVVETITVKSCPKDMVVDANGDIWVYCGGVPSWSTVVGSGPAICKISSTTNEVTSWDIDNVTTNGIKNIAINKAKDVVYFISDAVYAMNITDTALPTTKFIDATFYGMDVNPVNGNLWLCEADYAITAGTVHVYNLKAEKLKDFEVGYMPNSTTFSY